MLLTLRACALSMAFTALAGCSHHDAAESSGPLLVQAIEYDRATSEYEPLADGALVHLTPPPQGGQVLFIGARVQNLSGASMELTGRVRDAETGAIVQQDTRTVKMTPVPDQPGVVQTDPSSYSEVSNIALCPDYDDVDVAGRPCVLEVKAVDRATGSTGAVTLQVTPICAQTLAFDQTLCECECQAGYVLGKCAPKLDAGQ